MSPKLLAAALALAYASLTQAAGDSAPAKPLAKPLHPAQAARAARGDDIAREDLVGRTVFQSLLAEFALQRGEVALSLNAWNDLARRSRDPKALARAVEVAGFARQYDLALELTEIWLEVEPASNKARQTQSALLVQTNRLDELAPQVIRLLEEDKANLASNLMHLNRILARHSDKRAIQHLVDRVASPYADVPEAHFAMAQAAAGAGNMERAEDQCTQALLLRPDWEAAALLRAQLQARLGNAVAIDGLDDFVSRHPDAHDARLTLARLLIGEKRYSESRAHFDRLQKDMPGNAAVLYPAAMLALQQGDTATGRSLLEQLLRTDFPDKGAVHFFLGQLDDEQRKPEAALEHYQQVTGGDQYLAARARAAQILQQQGKIEAARTLLQTTRSSTLAESTQLLLAESQLLRDAGRHEEALALLDKALLQQPDNVDLLYETALLAERQGRPDILEARLKHLLKIKPDHAHALNALGYSWAERNINLGEAETLLANALRLAPEDPFILDSMGWVYFRQGRLGEALRTLEKAHALKADPEIAAHLAEVLWTLERKEDARRVLQDAARLHPDNEVLVRAIKKLLP